MPRARKHAHRRLQRGLPREADLPSVPELSSSPAPPVLADQPQAVASDTDPTEDAIRKMIEAAYT